MTTYRTPAKAKFLFALAAVLASAALAAPVAASAAPLNETEPNESPLVANGPVPADGFLQTISTSNDYDYAYLNLKAQQQVTISLTGVSGCIGYVHGVHFTATDAFGRIQLSNHHLSTSSHSKSTYLWTTPDVPVRLDVGDFDAHIGCQSLFKVEPASVILDGPLPTPPPRTLTATAVGPIVARAKNKVSISGSAYDGDVATARLTPLSSGQCPGASDSPDDQSGYPALWTGALPTGGFTKTVQLDALSAGNYFLCTWLVNPSSDITTLTASCRVKVLRRGQAKVLTRTVRHGKHIRAKIKYVKGFVEFRFTRHHKRVKYIKARVRHGRASVSTKHLPRKTLKLSIYGNGQRLTSTSVWIRR